MRYCPSPCRHSCFSDVWPLGASIFILCSFEELCSQLDMTRRPHYISGEQYLGGSKSRRNLLTFPSNYTRQLRETVHLTTPWNHQGRTDAVILFRKLKPLVQASGFVTENALEAENKLPDWATRVHKFSARAEKMYPGKVCRWVRLCQQARSRLQGYPSFTFCSVQ